MMDDDTRSLSDAFKSLQKEVEALRTEVAELREQVPKSKSPPLPAKKPEPPKIEPSHPEPFKPPQHFKFCWSCHARNPDDAGYCRECQADLSAKATKKTQAPEPPEPPLAEPEPAPVIDWERFMGVQLFAWVGGFALFLGVAFFVKYSFDNNLISPSTRVALGFLFGTGAIVAGLLLRDRGLGVTVETLCASGVAILYADVFGSRALYALVSAEAAFALMALVTVVAFVLAMRLNSKYVAILGLVGGFLTPPLLSTGIDRAFALFAYVTMLDAGIGAIAVKMDWGFLVPMAAAGTFAMEAGWTAKFFAVEKQRVLAAAIVWFCAGFLGLAGIARRKDRTDALFHLPAAALAFASLSFCVYMLDFRSLATQPVMQFVLLIFVNVELAYASLRREELRPIYILGGIGTFYILFSWTSQWLTNDLLLPALATYLAFGIIHAAVPALIQITRPNRSAWTWGYAFPALMLGLVVLNIQLGHIAGFLVWPFVLALGLVAITTAWLASVLWAAAVCVILVVGAFGAWTLRLPDVAGVIQILPLLAVFTLIFFAWSLFMGRRWPLAAGPGMEAPDPSAPAQLAATAALMPFALLMAVGSKLALPDPSSVFGLMLLLNILLLGVVAFRGLDAVAGMAVIATVGVEYCWHVRNFDQAHPALAVAWYGLFYGLFLVYPFVLRKRLNGITPWLAAAASGPAHFLLFYRAFELTMGKDYIGAVPAALAVPSLAALWAVATSGDSIDAQRPTKLAAFGAVALLFITLILPVQFDKEWLTFGWGLEGAALIWLHSRVRHPGLKVWGAALLAVAFVRLTLNQAVFSYHPRSGTPFFNWYLLVYGAVAACEYAAAQGFEDFEEGGSLALRSILQGFGTMLLFLLLNIEIADYFSKGAAITFDFSASLSQDMTYSLAWALFAIGVIAFGVANKAQTARYGGLALLSATIGKVFLHDLWRLGQLYRVASIIGLAVILILVSFMYQRFLSDEKKA